MEVNTNNSLRDKSQIAYGFFPKKNIFVCYDSGTPLADINLTYVEDLINKDLACPDNIYNNKIGIPKADLKSGFVSTYIPREDILNYMRLNSPHQYKE